MNINKGKLPILGVIFLSILLLLLGYDVLRRGIFSNKLGMNILVVGDRGVSLMLIRPDEGVVRWLNFPDTLKIKIHNSAATYPITSLWKYALSEKRPYEVVEKSLGLAMGIPVPRTIQIDGEVTAENVMGNLHKLSLTTDLSFRDRWLIRQLLVEMVTAKKVLEISMPKNSFDSVVEPDGKTFLTFNSVADLWVRNKCVLESVLNENVNISINNLTGQSGLGFLWSRQLESAGLRVIEVKADANDVSTSGKGCFFVVKGNFPMTEKLLTSQMGCVKQESLLRDMGIKLWLK